VRTLFLFIFESIGTSELILIGIIALVFLGPRKLPQIAKTIGKTIADFRNTTNEFKSTWEREVNFEEEERALRTGELPDTPIARMTPALEDESIGISAPEIKEIDKDAFDDLVASQASDQETASDIVKENDAGDDISANEPLSDKRTWL
jgi:Tat protein translocase TatB subunit